jgi:hypothetical protein
MFPTANANRRPSEENLIASMRAPIGGLNAIASSNSAQRPEFGHSHHRANAIVTNKAGAYQSARAATSPRDGNSAVAFMIKFSASGEVALKFKQLLQNAKRV